MSNELEKREQGIKIAESELVKPSVISEIKLWAVKDEVELFNSMKIVNKAIYSTPTPRNALMNREGAQGMIYDYVIDDYFKRMLDAITPMWDFKLADNSPELKQLNVIKETSKGIYTSFPQYHFVSSGSIVLKFQNGITRTVSDTGTGKVQLSKAGDYLLDTAAKGSVTDCFKRCCARLGLASDVYGRALASEYHKIVFYYLTQHFDKKNENTIKLTKSFINCVYASQQETIINFIKNEVITGAKPTNFGFPVDKQTTNFKTMSVQELINMVLDKMDNEMQTTSKE